MPPAFLYFFHQSLIDYQHTLTELKEVVETFEPNSNCYISQDFLENDGKSGLEGVIGICKVKYFITPFIALLLIGCNAKVTEEDLIGDYWVPTAGYKDGEPKGEPYGSSVISEALKFKDENTVYVEAYDRDFTYE
ncbi:hypothetical protein FHP05_05020 [Cerasibacillus terrae]|uniref:LXG domain-containing protein n=1 Tax=Cerasibacillus terrae TaxID=2498845 RepID=A0A5C8P0D0_9BACI|nr:T7SS effector LXG polymorphic toxin [Cerasibacillus terrae]TXL66747.1 hypothetical protein FHP05_05020 [Cerasibacillus terrae]